jgi:hypothetical protein
MRVDEFEIETAKTGKVSAVVTVMSIYCQKNAIPGGLIWTTRKPSSCCKAETAKDYEESSCNSEDASQKKRKGQIKRKK